MGTSVFVSLKTFLVLYFGFDYNIFFWQKQPQILIAIILKNAV